MGGTFAMPVKIKQAQLYLVAVVWARFLDENSVNPAWRKRFLSCAQELWITLLGKGRK